VSLQRHANAPPATRRRPAARQGTGVAGARLPNAPEGAPIPRRWRCVAHTSAEGQITRASDGEELKCHRHASSAKTCNEGATDSAEHFGQCEGEWAQDRGSFWQHAVRRALHEAGLVAVPRDAQAGAAALWCELTAPRTHWSAWAGPFPLGQVNSVLRANGMAGLKRPAQVRVLRRAMVNVAATLWRRRQELLTHIGNTQSQRSEVGTSTEEDSTTLQ
jgi:hypothetical protein